MKLFYSKNPDRYEVFIIGIIDNKFGTWKVAEINRFPTPYDKIHGTVIQYLGLRSRLLCKSDIKEIEEFTIKNVKL